MKEELRTVCSSLQENDHAVWSCSLHGLHTFVAALAGQLRSGQYSRFVPIRFSARYHLPGVAPVGETRCVQQKLGMDVARAARGYEGTSAPDTCFFYFWKSVYLIYVRFSPRAKYF